jgi:hypothetical protein
MGFFRTSALIVAIGLVAAPASATTTTTTTVAASALPSLVAELPACVAECLPTVGTEIGCDKTDLECMCDQESVFLAHLNTCIVKSECSKKEATSKAATLPTITLGCQILTCGQAGSDLGNDICIAMSGNPDSAALASASSLITMKTPEPTGNAASRKDHALVMAGLAAVGAVVV